MNLLRPNSSPITNPRFILSFSSDHLVDPPATLDLQEKPACWKFELEVSKFDPSKKKKTKPLLHEDEFQKGGHFSEDNAPHCQSIEPHYGYKEFLSRVFDRLRDDNIEVSTENPRTVKMRPQLLAEGTEIAVCLNFADLCRTSFKMHRKPDHVMKFLLGQMETKGLVNKMQRLEMKGLLSSRDFQAVFRRYIGAEEVLTQFWWRTKVLALPNVRW